MTCTADEAMRAIRDALIDGSPSPDAFLDLLADGLIAIPTDDPFREDAADVLISGIEFMDLLLDYLAGDDGDRG